MEVKKPGFSLGSQETRFLQETGFLSNWVSPSEVKKPGF
ncbi:hypothetical protein SPLC1_S207850 [Arthrospira platensis C1]|nr:hypothetical protein SPLC1_S207850 [Arthrospira platensis C1]